MKQYYQEDPQEAIVALAEIARIAEGGGDSSIQPNVVLRFTYFRKHLILDSIGEPEGSRRAALLSYENRRQELRNRGFEGFYHETYYSVLMLDSDDLDLPWINPDWLVMMDMYQSQDYNKALSGVEDSIEMLKGPEGMVIQREILLPLQYFRRYLILMHREDTEIAEESLERAIKLYRSFRKEDLDDEEVFETLLNVISELDSHLPWLEEAEVVKLKELQR